MTNEAPKTMMATRRKWFQLAAVPLALAAVAGCARSLTDRLVMFPSRQPIDEPGLASTFVPTAHGRLELVQPATQPTEPTAFVLEFTGNATRAEQVAIDDDGLWAGRSVARFAMNYPGYGQSEGDASLKSAAAAGVIAYDFVRLRAGDRPIFVVGVSLGTTVALHVATERPDVAGLVLTNPPPLRQLVLGRYGWWNLWLAAGPIALGIPGELDSIGNARRVRVPAVLVTSTRDESVPIGYQRRVVEAYAGERRVLERQDAGHNDPLDAASRRWLRQQIEWLATRGQIPQGKPG